MTDTGAPPPGWYPDPAGGGGSRWWDGTAWGAEAAPPAGGPGPSGPTGWTVTPPLASIGARFAALLLDGLIVGAMVAVVLLPVALLLGAIGSQGGAGEVIGIVVGLVVYLAVFAAVFAYWIVLEAGPYGQTIGKWVTGVRVVSAPDGARLPLGRSVGRTLSRSFLSGIFYLGYVWAFFDERRRTWHDSLADTVVVEAEPTRKPPLGELLRSARAR